MKKDSKILVAGSNGMVGSSIVRFLEKEGYTNLIKGTRNNVDFTNQDETERYFYSEKPEYVFLAAAKVGGILGNKNHKAEFIYDNLMIQSNIIHNSYKFGVKKLLFLGSSCIYPKEPTLPITEDQLMSGRLETSNDAYAVAKIAGIYMCKSYRQQYGFNAISAMPCNLYGPGDNYHPENSHVVPGIIRKIHNVKHQYDVDEESVQHKGVTLWGDGSPMREFLYVDDLADACILLMQNYDKEELINVGSGKEISIKTLAYNIAATIGFETENIHWDTSKPNGTMRKVMDVSKIKSLGWEPKVSIDIGLRFSYEDFLKKYG